MVAVTMLPEIEHHVGRPCSCGAVACSPERGRYVKAFVATLIGEGPEVDGFRRRRAREQDRESRARAWAEVQQNGAVA